MQEATMLKNILRSSLLEKVLLFLLGCAFIILTISSIHTGLADNGDFSRIMTPYSSGPIGFSENWPDPTGTEYTQRFFFHWIPYWNLNFEKITVIPSILSSALLLWLPGILLNLILHSSSELYIPFLSFAPRIILLFCLIQIIFFIRKEFPLQRNLLYLVSVFPLLLICTDGNYTRIFNTFYQESASLSFLSLLFLSIGYVFLSKKRLLPLFCLLTLTALLTWSKASLIFIPLLVIILLITLRKKYSTLLIILSILSCILISVISWNISSDKGIRFANHWHSYFNGILYFSADPYAHTQRNHLPISREDLPSYIAADAYSGLASEFYATPQAENISFKNSFINMMIEPSIIWKIFSFASADMQQLKLSENFYGTIPTVAGPEYLSHPFTLWSNVKALAFPRGISLLIISSLSGIFFLYSYLRSKKESLRLVSLLGIFTFASLICDMFLAIAGNGIIDLTKHLYLTNFMFDILLVLMITHIAIQVLCQEKKVLSL